MGIFCFRCASSRPSASCARASAMLVWDAYPLSPGHALVIPRRHIGSWFDTTAPERADLRWVLPQRAAYWNKP